MMDKATRSSHGCPTVAKDRDEKKIPITIVDIFATGVAEIPTIGFTEHPKSTSNPQLRKNVLSKGKYTCTNELFPPTFHETYETNKYYMLSGIS